MDKSGCVGYSGFDIMKIFIDGMPCKFSTASATW